VRPPPPKARSARRRLCAPAAAAVSQGSKGTRLKQVTDWLAKDPASLIIFDECHKCKNYAPGPDAKPTKTAACAVQLQQTLPRARVLYASATGASTPENLAYMVRLGTFGMPSFQDLLGTLKHAGLGSLELFAMGATAHSPAAAGHAVADPSPLSGQA
jgi:hypothetical protein